MKRDELERRIEAYDQLWTDVGCPTYLEQCAALAQRALTLFEKFKAILEHPRTAGWLRLGFVDGTPAVLYRGLDIGKKNTPVYVGTIVHGEMDEATAYKCMGAHAALLYIILHVGNLSDTDDGSDDDGSGGPQGPPRLTLIKI